MNPYNIKEMVENFALECDEDYVGLWRVPGELSENGVPDDLLLEETLKVLWSLAVTRNIVFGNPGETAFIPWSVSFQGAIDRIRAE